jgi:hypothetical protein
MLAIAYKPNYYETCCWSCSHRAFFSSCAGRGEGLRAVETPGERSLPSLRIISQV